MMFIKNTFYLFLLSRLHRERNNDFQVQLSSCTILAGSRCGTKCNESEIGVQARELTTIDDHWDWMVRLLACNSWLTRSGRGGDNKNAIENKSATV